MTAVKKLDFAEMEKQDPSLELDTRLMNWCESAVTETFESLFGITPNLKHMIKNPAHKPVQEISGVIGFIQTHLEGTLALGFNEKCIQSLMTDFYSEEMIGINEKLVGGVCEMTNIVFGLIKGHYGESGYTFQMCLPVVVVGANHTIFSSICTEKLLLVFEIPHGQFWLELMLIRHNQTNENGEAP